MILPLLQTLRYNCYCFRTITTQVETSPTLINKICSLITKANWETILLSSLLSEVSNHYLLLIITNNTNYY